MQTELELSCKCTIQCKVCEEGVALHSQVRPDSMKGLHQRMEELLEDYR